MDPSLIEPRFPRRLDRIWTKSNHGSDPVLTHASYQDDMHDYMTPLHVDYTILDAFLRTKEMMEKNFAQKRTHLYPPSSALRVQHNALFLLSESLTDLVSRLPITHDDVLALFLVDEPGARSLDGHDDAEGDCHLLGS